MENNIPVYLLRPLQETCGPPKVNRTRLSFLDKTILNSAGAVKSIYLQAESASGESLIQRINPHVKLFSLIYIAVVISVINNLQAQLLASAIILIFYIIARLSITGIYRRILFLAFLFGFLVVFPASLNIITPGRIILNVVKFENPSHFWIYEIPRNIGFTENGIRVVLLVFLRVLNSVSFAMLIVFTTPFASFIKAFRILGVPDTFLMIVSLAYKYIFILSRTIEETYFALKSRLSGNIKNESIRKLVGGRIFFIFKRSMIIYENTYYAMVSRGYRGNVKLHSQKQLTFPDYAALVVIAVLGIVLILF
jgi:cobalt/nickel transport system permease protein